MDVLLTDKHGVTYEGKLRFTVPVGINESLVKFEISSNLLDETDPTTDFMMSYVPVITRSSCLAACQDKYTNPKTGEKIRGRGACKAGCWVDTAAKAITSAAAAILSLK